MIASARACGCIALARTHKPLFNLLTPFEYQLILCPRHSFFLGNDKVQLSYDRLISSLVLILGLSWRWRFISNMNSFGTCSFYIRVLLLLFSQGKTSSSPLEGELENRILLLDVLLRIFSLIFR
jgi:hypothetical protein